MKKCSEVECEKAAYARGYCQHHYDCARRDGLFGLPTCTFEGCGRTGHNRGLCGGHAQQRDKGQPLRPIRKPVPQGSPCAVPGCPRVVSANGYCPRHESQARKYGLTAEQMSTWDALPCAVCGQITARMHTDHDHVSGRTRGRLCHGCNVALGHLGEDVDRMRALIAYVEKYRRNLVPTVS
jgi:hypothetical protein